MPPDAIVVGGGPAGLSAACGLVRAGFRVLVLEQQRNWQGRVCGGFINPEGVGHLAWLGVLDELRALGVGVPKARLTLAGGGEGLVPVTRGGVEGLGVPREVLESVLGGLVLRERGEIRSGTRVTAVHRDGPRWHVEARASRAGDEGFTADLVVLADGRFSPARAADAGPDREQAERESSRRVDGAGPEEAAHGSRRRVEGWYGWNASFDGVSARPGHLSMHFYPGGYVGVLTFADGETNVCGLARRGGSGSVSWEEVLDDALERLPALRALTSGAHRRSPWRGVGPLPFGRSRSGSGGPILAGDAGGVGDPYMGEGISRALGSGRLLYEAAACGPGADPVAIDRLTARYRVAWRRRYASRLRLGWLVRHLQDHPVLFDRLLAHLLRRPSALHRLSSVFHDFR